MTTSNLARLTTRYTDDLRELVKCRKPDCGRLVPKGTLYCCTPCAVAAEGRYEIDEHSDGCNVRFTERSKEEQDR